MNKLRYPTASIAARFSLGARAMARASFGARNYVQAASIAAALMVATTSTSAHAEDVKHTVVRGDTCASIAAKYYGDSRLVELIHQANGMTSPPPHNLKEGTVLLIPPKPGSVPAAPDAKVGFVRNKVEVLAPTPQAARVSAPLFRGNRVSTESESSAGVVFRDETRYTLGEKTLIVILSDVRAGAQRATGETTLVSGELRTRLSELAGRPPHVVRTESATVTMTGGENVLTVDAKKASRLAAHQGAASVAASGKKVDVPEGFGSKAEMGKAPTPPAPLPAVPSFTERPAALVFGDSAAPVAIHVHYAPGSVPSNAPAVQHWHVQIAKDAAFTDLVTDLRVPLSVTELSAQVPIGSTYYSRVSAVDGDVFEGKYSEVVPLRAVQAAVLAPQLGGRRVRAPGMLCSVDGGPEVAADDLYVRGADVHALRCGPLAEPGVRSVLSLPKKSAAEWQSALFPAPHAELIEKRRTATETEFELTLTDAAGMPVDALPVLAPHPVQPIATGGVAASVAPLRRLGPGRFASTITWQSIRAPHVLNIEVPEYREAQSAALAPAEIAVGAPPVRLELESGLSLLASGTAISEFGGRAFIGVGVRIPLEGGGFAVGVRGARDGFPARDIDPAICDCNGVTAKFQAWTLELPLAFRFGAARAPWVPYVAVTPGLLAQSGTYTLVGGAQRDASATLVSISGALGLERKLGPGGVFGELAYRSTGPLSFEFATVSHRGGLATLGYRIGFDL